MQKHSHPGTEVIFYIYQLFTEDAGLAIQSWPRAKHWELSGKTTFTNKTLEVSFIV